MRFMMYIRCLAGAAAVAGALWFAGCSGVTVVSNHVDTDTTGYDGQATLSFVDTDGNYNTQKITVRANNDGALANVRVLGLTDWASTLCLAVPADGSSYFPQIAAGFPADSSERSIYLPSIVTENDIVATEQQQVPGSLLYEVVNNYDDGIRTRETTVQGLGTAVSQLVSGHHTAVVACAFQKLSYSAGQRNLVEVAEQADTSSQLANDMLAYKWLNLFGNRGVGYGDSVKVWAIDGDRLPYVSGGWSLDDTVLLIVAPTGEVTPPPVNDAARVVLTWDKNVDLDLHLVRKNTSTGEYNMYSAINDCFWKYPEQDWGLLNDRDDNPRLVATSNDGTGTETIVLDRLTSTEDYAVGVDYWGYWNGSNTVETNQAVTATVRVYLNGATTPSATYTDVLYHGKPEYGDMVTSCHISGAGSVARGTRGEGEIIRGPHAPLGDKPKP